MKTKIFIFASLLCMYNTYAVHASECIGSDCEIAPINVIETNETLEIYEEPVWDMPDIPAPQAIVIPEHNVRVYSVKPTIPDDGTGTSGTTTAASTTTQQTASTNPT